MAQGTVVQLVSDLSGKELADGTGETVSFALDGRAFEIDLSGKEADRLRSLFQSYIAAGRRLGSRTGTSRRTTVPSGGSGMSKEELANVRAWAKQNGYEVSDRGRIKSDVMDAYHASR